MSGPTWKATLLLLAAALGGAAVGGVATAVRLRGMDGFGHGGGTQAYVRLLDRNLHLSGAQQDSVRAILARHRGAMDSLWSALRPRLQALRDTIRTEIGAQLTPSQMARYTALTQRLDAERRRRMERGHGVD